VGFRVKKNNVLLRHLDQARNQTASMIDKRIAIHVHIIHRSEPVEHTRLRIESRQVRATIAANPDTSIGIFVYATRENGFLRVDGTDIIVCVKIPGVCRPM
jgi:hypothetical protein